jgi:hypothetical protein
MDSEKWVLKLKIQGKKIPYSSILYCEIKAYCRFFGGVNYQFPFGELY